MTNTFSRNRILVLLVLGCSLLALVGCRRGRGRTRVINAAQANPTTDDEKTLYALGMVMAQRTEEFSLTPDEIAIVQRGMTDELTDQPRLAPLDQYGPRIAALAEQRAQARVVETRRRGTAFAESAARAEGAVQLPSGLVYRDLEVGTGASPTAADEVTVHYRGTLIDGTEFDSSIARNEPATFGLGRVIPCWTEGVQRMKVGGRAVLVCPPDIAYGDRAQQQIPAGSTLKFEVQLISITPPTPAPAP